MSTEEDFPNLRGLLAAAWASGYWHGTSHTGPLNDAAVDRLNPYTDTAA